MSRYILSIFLLFGLSAHASEVQWPYVESVVQKDPVLESRIDKMLADMSIKEKVGQLIQAEIKNISPEQIRKYNIGSVLSGGGSWPSGKGGDPVGWIAAADRFYKGSQKSSTKIPVIWGIDAVHGHNNVVGATLFPHNIGLGATRNPKLISEIAAATAREVASTGIRWTFAPTLAVARDQRWGRTYESYAENPELVADYAAAMVAGLQGVPAAGNFLGKQKVIATAKHFIADGGTILGTGKTGGNDQGDTQVDELTLRDIHGAGYFPALKAGVQTVMASFSAWNGERSHGSHYLLTEVLKNQMGFDGFVIGDWNGHALIPGCSDQSCADAINAGVDMIMVPEEWLAFYKNTVRQVKKGVISKERLDDAVRRILRVKMRAGLFDRGLPSQQVFAHPKDILGHPRHREIARQAVRESLVLLKNSNATLPINPGSNVLVAGSAAKDLVQQSGGWTITWQGDKTSNADFPGATSIYEGFAQAVSTAGGELQYSASGKYDKKPDVAIVVFGEKPYAEFEGDLMQTVEFTSPELAVQQKLQAEGIPVVAVFITGRPLFVTPQIDASDAFVVAWLPGSEGQGVADVLFKKTDGSVNFDFRGKLSFSWPKAPEQVPMNIGDENYDPLFPYGFGLSY